MLPTLSLGPWQADTYGLMVGLAIVVMAMAGYYRLRQLDLPSSTIIRGGTPIFLGGLVIGFGAYYLGGLPHLIRTGIWRPSSGPSITWGLVGAVLVAILSCLKFRVPLGQAFDLGILACPLGQAIARFGCFAVGCCHGQPTGSWLAMDLPDPHGLWLPRYPTQIMHAIANLLIFFVLLAVERYGRGHPDKPAGSRIWPFDGFVFLLFVNLFFLQRFVVAFFRVEPSPILGPLSWMHLHAIIGMSFATLLIVRYWPPRRHLVPRRDAMDQTAG